jgi:carbon storage regulator
MLYLMRKQDESIIINNDIELKVIEIKGKSVKIGFTFPKGASVLRKELYDKIKQENMAAATSSGEALNMGDVEILGQLKLKRPSATPTDDTAASSDTE